MKKGKKEELIQIIITLKKIRKKRKESETDLV